MTSESFAVVALPYSCAADAEFHVSLFIAPRLTPTGKEEPLRRFGTFVRWAEGLADAATTIEIWDDRGPLTVTPLLDDVSTDLWDAVFAPGTPVRRTKIPDWDDRHWRSFSAAFVHNATKALHLLAVQQSPTGLPAATGNFLTDHVFARGKRRVDVKEDRRQRDRDHDERPRWEFDETLVTAALDDLVGETDAGKHSLEAIARRMSGLEPLDRVLAELHRLRRYYERPESAQKWRDRPDPRAKLPELARPDPDFHERCAIVGNHRELLRRLGLVVDVRVTDASRLRKSAWLAARIAPAGDPAKCVSHRTRCEAVDTSLVTVAETDDWNHGRLCLGDPKRFDLLDLEVDGSGLKYERYLLTLPRLMLSEDNLDPVHAAPPALRSAGFTVARTRRAEGTQDRLARQRELAAELGPVEGPALSTEDVTRGVRVEVWDATAKTWQSLHTRRIDVHVEGHGRVLRDALDEGFIQGTAATETTGVTDSPIHIHEAVFGWEGWSLSAPKPGMRVIHDHAHDETPDPRGLPDRNEILKAQGTEVDPVTPIVIRTAVEPGTLPRLRYGRSYMFRAWAVDLAGNSRPHTLRSDGAPTKPLVSAVGKAIEQAASAKPDSVLASFKRATLNAAIVDVASGPRVGGALTEVLDELRGAAGDDVHRRVVARLRARTENAPPPREPLNRGGLIADAFRAVARDLAEPVVSVVDVVDKAPIAEAIAAGEAAKVIGSQAVDLTKLVTPLKPFLRWDPVQPPAMVARHAYTAGESLRQIVIRSGVTQDPDTLAITVTPSTAYAKLHAALGYHATCERHLVPPKSSQTQAELHGCLDKAIGASATSAHDKALAVALRESGTLFDLVVPSLTDPSKTDPQPNVSLYPPKPSGNSELRKLPLKQGEAPGPGQYVLHDVNQLVLPYLPDPIARGVSFVFQDAGRDRVIAYPFATEGFTTRYDGAWPEPKPFRLVLTDGAALRGEQTGTAITIAVPPSDVLRFRLASSLDVGDLDLLGVWRSLPDRIRNDADVAEAAADGWLWALTPFEDVTLVHAVPRPIEAPAAEKLTARRGEGSTESQLVGGLDVHGPSTESVTAEATWTETLDDVNLPRHEEHNHRSVAFTTDVSPSEEFALLWHQDMQMPVAEGQGVLGLHKNVHKFPDTKHRVVTYRFRATTRFREYFDASELVPSPPPIVAPATTPAFDAVIDDGKSVVSAPVTVSVPSSARPAPPAVHSVIPLFRWDEATEPEQPLAYRRRRRAGVRIYLERPWYSSGDGELLAVLLAPRGNDTDLEPWVSQWGGDPVWVTTPVDNRALRAVDLSAFVVTAEDDKGDALPATEPTTLPLASLPKPVDVLALGYEPQYSESRELWYVDVAFQSTAMFWPFVRLSVARYQPDSINGCHLSAPVRCDFVQLTPQRTATVARTDARHVRVVVSGPVGSRHRVDEDMSVERLRLLVDENRTVVARLQQQDPAIPTDLGWHTVASTDLVIRGQGPREWDVSWVGALEGPDDIALARPGDNGEWRVVVEEWEKLPGDPSSLAPDAKGDDREAVWEKRLVYADEFVL